jgi:hypothetical protein
MKIGTPHQRQLSISKRSVRLRRRVGGHAVDVTVAVVLAADVLGRICRRDRAEQRVQRVLERGRVMACRDLHGGGADHLHEVVDDDVARRADGVVEVPAVLEAEALGNRDLDRGGVVARPDRLEPRIGEPQVEDLRRAHLPGKWSIRYSWDSSMY